VDELGAAQTTEQRDQDPKNALPNNRGHRHPGTAARHLRMRVAEGTIATKNQWCATRPGGEPAGEDQCSMTKRIRNMPESSLALAE
jgi:hypothetical protein